MSNTNRLHYMDNLRALAMLTGVLFHAALAYSPLMYPYFPTADRQHAIVVDVVIWFFHLFRMPLFFVIAGIFAAMLVAKQGVAGLFANRSRRILLPFLLFWPLVFWTLVATTFDAAESVQQASPVLVLIKKMRGAEEGGSTVPTTSHLWFLYYLMIFYLLTWACRQFNLKELGERVRNCSPFVQLSIFPLLLVPALASVTVPHPAPESFLPQFWALGFFGLYFAFGYTVFGFEAVIDRYRSRAIKLLLMSVALYIVFLWLLDRHNIQSPHLAMTWMLAILEAYISVWMTCVSLVYGKAFLNLSSRVLRYLADTSYWIYIAHLPILFLVQYPLMDRQWHWLVKYSVSVLFTLSVCFVSYHLLVRNTVVGHLLNGRRQSMS